MGLNYWYPPIFDSTTMLSPSTWTETSAVIEVINQSEAGTDSVDVTRYDKLSIAVTYKIAETVNSSNVGNGWVKTLKEFSKKDSIVVSRYDPIVGAYEQRTMRMRDFEANLVPKSDMLPSLVGVWEISFTLKEF